MSHAGCINNAELDPLEDHPVGIYNGHSGPCLPSVDGAAGGQVNLFSEFFFLSSVSGRRPGWVHWDVICRQSASQ